MNPSTLVASQAGEAGMEPSGGLSVHSLRTLVSSLDLFIIEVDRRGRVLYLNKLQPGFSYEDVLGKDFCTWSPPEMHGPMRATLEQVFTSGLPGSLVTVGKISPDQTGWYESRLAPVMQGDQVSTVIMTTTDITARKIAEEEARKQNDLLSLFYHMPFIGMAITSPETKRWLRANDRLCEILGYPHDELIDKTWAEITYPEDLPLDVFEFNRMMAGQIDHYSMEKRFIRKSGALIDAEIDVRCVRKNDGSPAYFVATVQDISTRKAHERSLRHLAHYDLLTDLPNRTLLSDRLTQNVLLAKRNGTRLATLFIDLDNFKPVNDAYGHAAGDLLLRAVAARIKTCVRASDTVARMGGDEFIVLLAPVDSQTQALQVAEKIHLALKQPFVLEDGHTAHISSSTGIAVFPDHASTPDGLLRCADNAMYAAKAAGRDGVVVYIAP